MSFNDLERRAALHRPAAVVVVHIGGHLAFDIGKIASFCKDNDIILLEDCAHAHGAEWKGKKAGMWGDCGFYSLYATKTITTGEGGILVTRHKDLVNFAKSFRNYGKPDFTIMGMNFRMNEFTAALGVIQTERLPDIVSYKNEYAAQLDSQYSNHIKFPSQMISGYYKYVVFDPIENSTGKVYDNPCHRILRSKIELPNTEWVANNHWCVPIYYDRS